MRRLANNERIGRAEAMRQSMIELIDKGSPQEAHPAFWAPFVVVGEGGSRKVVFVRYDRGKRADQTLSRFIPLRVMGRDFVHDINEAAPPPVAEGIFAGARTGGWGQEQTFGYQIRKPLFVRVRTRATKAGSHAHPFRSFKGGKAKQEPAVPSHFCALFQPLQLHFEGFQLRRIS